MQEGINCIRVSEGADYNRLAACTNGGTLAYMCVNSEYGICSAVGTNRFGRRRCQTKAKLHLRLSQLAHTLLFFW